MPSRSRRGKNAGGRKRPADSGLPGVTLGWAAAACGGRLQGAGAADPIAGICLDSRGVKPGEIFVALAGRRTDGHRFMPAALAKGAAAVLCRRPPSASAPAIVVPDPRRALGRIAAAYRRRFPRVKIVAVSGSTGKTAAKEMVARVLASRHRVLQSQGNLNNDLGLPLTLLRLRRHHTAAAVELGMSAPGEIRQLAKMAKPHIGLLTNIGDAHLGHFRNRRSVARAKAELLEELMPGGTAVLNADDPELARLAARRRLTFGMAKGADVQVVSTGVHYAGTHVVLSHRRRRAEIRLRALGAHQAWNAAAAVAAGLAAGVPFPTGCRALAGFRPETAMRLQLLRLGPHRILNDAYNSNPQSAAAALGLLAELPARGRKIFVAGSMLELGAATQASHANLGREAAISGVYALLAVGREARAAAKSAAAAGVEKIATLPTAEGAARVLARWLSADGDLILIKGSRRLQLETIVQDLQCRWRRSRGRRAAGAA